MYINLPLQKNNGLIILTVWLLMSSFFFKDFIYLFIHERHTQREAETQAEEWQAPCREPDVRLHPGTPGSHPRLKAALSH